MSVPINLSSTNLPLLLEMDSEIIRAYENEPTNELGSKVMAF